MELEILLDEIQKSHLESNTLIVSHRDILFPNYETIFGIFEKNFSANNSSSFAANNKVKVVQWKNTVFANNSINTGDPNSFKTWINLLDANIPQKIDRNNINFQKYGVDSKSISINLSSNNYFMVIDNTEISTSSSDKQLDDPIAKNDMFYYNEEKLDVLTGMFYLMKDVNEGDVLEIKPNTTGNSVFVLTIPIY